MKRIFLIIVLPLLVFCSVKGQFHVDNRTMLPCWKLNGGKLLTVPDDGLWAIATDWKND